MGTLVRPLEDARFLDLAERSLGRAGPGSEERLVTFKFESWEQVVIFCLLCGQDYFKAKGVAQVKAFEAIQTCPWAHGPDTFFTYAFKVGQFLQLSASDVERLQVAALSILYHPVLSPSFDEERNITGFRRVSILPVALSDTLREFLRHANPAVAMYVFHEHPLLLPSQYKRVGSTNCRFITGSSGLDEPELPPADLGWLVLDELFVEQLPSLLRTSIAAFVAQAAVTSEDAVTMYDHGFRRAQERTGGLGVVECAFGRNGKFWLRGMMGQSYGNAPYEVIARLSLRANDVTIIFKVDFITCQCMKATAPGCFHRSGLIWTYWMHQQLHPDVVIARTSLVHALAMTPRSRGPSMTPAASLVPYRLSPSADTGDAVFTRTHGPTAETSADERKRLYDVARGRSALWTEAEAKAKMERTGRYYIWTPSPAL